MANLISKLLVFLSAHNGENVLYALLACWPGTMFLVGIIFESRLLPLGKPQSRAFIPGDFTLAPAMLAFLRMYEATGVLILAGKKAWWWGVAGVMLLIAFFLRRGDCRNYKECFSDEQDEAKRERQWRRLIWSPTKVWHDLCGYFLIPTLLVGLGVPQLLAALKIPGVFAVTWTYWIPAAICLAFYIACVRWDGKRPEPDAMTMLARHTPDWAPIWTRRGWEKIRRAFSKLFEY